MKAVSRIIIVTLAIFASIVSAQAQSPQEQLQQLATQLQKSPTDSSLREKIIRLAAEMKPPPAVPEEAERRMARGTAAFKGAKSIADYQDAVQEFELAVTAAPWYTDAYFNLGVAQDKAEKYADALQSLKFALMSSPDSKEIKALMYEVEYRSEKANSPETKAAIAKAAADKQSEEISRQFEGSWYKDFYSGGGDKDHVVLKIKHTSSGSWTMERTDELDGSVTKTDPHFTEIKFDGEKMKFRYERGLQYPDHFEMEVAYEISASITENSSQLSLTYTPLPFATPERAAHWAGYGYGPPKQYTDVYKRL